VDERSDGGLADPPDGQRAQGDAKLRGRDVLIELADDACGEPSASALFSKLIELRFPDPDEGVLRRHEEPICEDQQQGEAEGHKRARVHERAILAPPLGS